MRRVYAARVGTTPRFAVTIRPFGVEATRIAATYPSTRQPPPALHANEQMLLDRHGVGQGIERVDFEVVVGAVAGCHCGRQYPPRRVFAGIQ